jgi:ABC-2 type transport system ATP-binding protein
LRQGKLVEIQSIKQLVENAFKKVTISTKDKLARDYFKLDNIMNLVQKGNKASFIYKGDIDVLLKKIALLDIEDAFIEEPSLEEIFLHYYK